MISSLLKEANLLDYYINFFQKRNTIHSSYFKVYNISINILWDKYINFSERALETFIQQNDYSLTTWMYLDVK